MNVDVEIVLLATGDPDALDTAVRAVRQQLPTQAAKTWCLTIAVDDTNVQLHTAALQVADELPSVSVRTLTPGLDLAGRRLAFASSPAEVVAFIRTTDDADLGPLLAPAFRIPVIHTTDVVGPRLFSRRHALGLLGSVSITALLAACSSSTSSADTTLATDTTSVSAATVPESVPNSVPVSAATLVATAGCCQG